MERDEAALLWQVLFLMKVIRGTDVPTFLSFYFSEEYPREVFTPFEEIVRWTSADEKFVRETAERLNEVAEGRSPTERSADIRRRIAERGGLRKFLESLDIHPPPERQIPTASQ